MEVDSKKITDIMQEQGLDAKQLADKMGKTPEGIFYILAMRRTKLSTLTALAAALRVKPKDLLTS